ncbi:MAG: phosphate acyltransferase [Clostridia bacterium]|nr:phosphate acyltransferase [Clostridia bacterium]
MKIIIDINGSDKGPGAIVKGAGQALEKYPELGVVLVGKAEEASEFATQFALPEGRYEILDAREAITNYDHPAEAIYKKQDASMVVAMKALSEREDLDGMITTGNTGAVLAGCVRFLSLPDRVRPALAALIPDEKGSDTCLVDTGATVDCTPQMLHHFAHLGVEFMRKAYDIENPRVGLLSNGTEASKGNKLVKETYPLLENDSELNFIGNVEGSSCFTGICDVLVADGFAGNQVMKVTEGTYRRMITEVFTFAKKTGSKDAMQLGMSLMDRYDIGSLGGGYILGIQKPVIKARGNSGEKAIVSICGMFKNLAQHRTFYEKT